MKDKQWANGCHKTGLARFLPFAFCTRVSRVAAIHGCHEEALLASSLLKLSLSESLSLDRRLGALNLCGSKMSLTVKDVTMCLASCTDSSSAAESSWVSSVSLLRLPRLLLSMRELTENRSLPCMLLVSAQRLYNERRVAVRRFAVNAHGVTKPRVSLLGVD